MLGNLTRRREGANKISFRVSMKISLNEHICSFLFFNNPILVYIDYVVAFFLFFCYNKKKIRYEYVFICYVLHNGIFYRCVFILNFLLMPFVCSFPHLFWQCPGVYRKVFYLFQYLALVLLYFYSNKG